MPDYSGYRVVLYSRVSSDEQARYGESIDDQQLLLRRWAEENRCVVVGEYSDPGYSGKKIYTTRPGLTSLLNRVKQGGVDLAVFTMLDRWTRRPGDYYAIDDILTAHDCHWATVLEDYETATTSGRFKVSIMLAVNQQSSDVTGDRIKFVFAEKRRRGEIVSGMMPRGYKVENKKPVVDTALQPAIAAFWNTYVSTHSLGAAQDAAQAEGLLLRTSTASRMLNNAAAYAGEIQGIKTYAYISEADRDWILNDRKRKAGATKRTGMTYLFTGILYCGECGGRMGAHRQTSNHNPFYNCTVKYGRRDKHCSNSVNIYERDIESFALEALAPALNSAAAQLLSHKSEKDTTAQINRLRARKNRATEAYLDGIIEKDELARERDRIDEEILNLEAAARRVIPPSLPSNWREIYDSLDRPHRRAFWQSMRVRITVNPDRTLLLNIE